jgi:hypothetical protein
LAIPFWLSRGKALLKQKLAHHVNNDISSLPFNQQLIDWLQSQKDLGRRLVLCTASDKSIAGAIANHLKLFDGVIASEGVKNLAGKNKANALVEKYGENGFDYVGNSSVDLLVWKKSKQLEKARNTVISDVDEILDNSFLGDLQNKIGDFRNALSEILKSDKRRTRTIIQKVLEPYVDVSDNDFVKLSRKAVNDFFDWAVQSKSGDQSINKDIARILLEEGGIGEEVINFVKSVKRNPEHDLYNNHIINIIEVIPSKLSGEGHPTNIKVKGLDNKVYDQNNIIFAFRELRNYLKGQKKSESTIYDKLKLLAVLQSGLSTSPISFTNLIPYEDFSEIYSKVLDRLEELPNMEDFYNLGVFQRNNWNNDDVVPTKAAIKTFMGIYNPAMKYLPKNVKAEVEKGNIPPVVSISTLSPEGKSEYIVYTWKEIPKGKKESEMREEGDFSFLKKGLFKKVYDIRDLEYIHSSNDKDYFVYKSVNAWGDGFRAQEFYDEAFNEQYEIEKKYGLLKPGSWLWDSMLDDLNAYNLKKSQEAQE